MPKEIKIKQEGLSELTDDDRDLRLGTIIKWPKLEELPKEYLVRPLTIKDQMADGNDDFCAACAGTGMIEPKEEVELFYPFLFAAAKYESDKDPDSFGLNMRHVGKALKKWGVPEVKDVPEEVKSLPPDKRRRFENYPEGLREKAKKHKALSYVFVDGPYDCYDNARAMEWYFRKKKQHIMFGVKFGWLLTDFFLEGKPNGLGHALWQGGWYFDGIVAVNSVGKGAGEEGMHCISRETFNYYVGKYGMMMITDMPKEKIEHHIQNNIKVDDNWLIQLLKIIRTSLCKLN